MQLTFAARDQLMAGKDKWTAFRNAIRIVGPACVLTHAAAGLSLLGLLTSSQLSHSAASAKRILSTAIALVTTLSLVPAFGVSLIRDEARLVATFRAADPGVATLRRLCGWIARTWSAVRPLLASWTSRSSPVLPSSTTACPRALASLTRCRLRSGR